MTASEIYDREVRLMPPSERLRLATLILNEIPAMAVVDYSEEWSEQDLGDFSQKVWNHSPLGNHDTTSR